MDKATRNAIEEVNGFLTILSNPRKNDYSPDRARVILLLQAKLVQFGIDPEDTNDPGLCQIYRPGVDITK